MNQSSCRSRVLVEIHAAGRVALALLTICIFMTACVSTPLPRNQSNAAQTDQLKALLQKQGEITRFAETMPNLANAVVKLRTNKALVILTPARGKVIDPNTVKKLNKYIRELTGLKKKAIMLIKRRTAEGEE